MVSHNTLYSLLLSPRLKGDTKCHALETITQKYLTSFVFRRIAACFAGCGIKLNT